MMALASRNDTESRKSMTSMVSEMDLGTSCGLHAACAFTLRAWEKRPERGEFDCA